MKRPHGAKMKISACQRIVTGVIAGWLGFCLIGCSPTEKKIDKEESKGQLIKLRDELQKEHGGK